eukprot:CAMPEP_0113260818 /NCGR_PEP_ID=MMETSP0008_2-20120614/17076_1 /TAXON_ID=97485 /ORGANISM="Prymnesium parvum" /LENGTH=140 /DNA_ID=CAMNT_0000109405 /DNA_START=1185 /DNA_END=1607 /DNA_ORIENTATION=+ /assembly_acc=CAM_ASM_000153
MVDVRDPKDVHLFLADREVREFLETGELAKFALRCKENLGRRERLLDELLDFVRVRHVPYEQRESGRAPTRQRHAEGGRAVDEQLGGRVLPSRGSTAHLKLQVGRYAIEEISQHGVCRQVRELLGVGAVKAVEAVALAQE